ncbi:unnamed protein product, partial [Nesidiocoris tenuis]
MHFFHVRLGSSYGTKGIPGEQPQRQARVRAAQPTVLGRRRRRFQSTRVRRTATVAPIRTSTCRVCPQKVQPQPEWSTLGETLHRELSSTSSRGYDSSDNQHSPKSPVFSNGTLNGGHSSPSPTVYYGTSRRSSIHSNGEPPQEVSPAHVKFVRDTSKCWYKATISREEAINLLRDRAPGTFVVRDSNSFPGAFGLALKVATPPPNAGKSPTGDPANELVRHFLIEPTSRGVRLKGCSNEPVF